MTQTDHSNEYTIRARDIDGLFTIELDGAVKTVASRAAVGRLLMSQGYRREVALSVLDDLSTADSGVAAVTFRALDIIR